MLYEYTFQLGDTDLGAELTTSSLQNYRLTMLNSLPMQHYASTVISETGYATD